MVALNIVSGSAFGGTPVQPPEDPAITATVPVLPPDDSSAAPPAVEPPVVIPPAVAQPAVQPPLINLKQAVLKQVKQDIAAYRDGVWHWQSLMGLRRTHFSQAVNRIQGPAYARWVLKSWKSRAQRLHTQAKHWMAARTESYQDSVNRWRRAMGLKSPVRQLAVSGSIEYRFIQWRKIAKKVYRQFQNPPQKAGFSCIHPHEGAWNDRDSGHNGHYGGLQMGKHEWRTFGYPYTHKLYAYLATPLEQYWAAYRYWKVSGFHPWPQTAQVCGLL